MVRQTLVIIILFHHVLLVFAHHNITEREHLGEELSDVFLYLVRLADVCCVDLVSCIKSKIQKNGAKYPCKLVSVETPLQ